MSNITRRSLVAAVGLGALGLVGCSGEADPPEVPVDEEQDDEPKDDAVEGDVVEFSGLSVRVPDGWDALESGDTLSISSDVGAVMIQAGIEYSTDEGSMADAIASGAASGDHMDLAGPMTRGLLNGSLCYSAPLASDEAPITGEVRAIISDGVCWSVLCTDWEETDGATSVMVADTITVD